MLDRLENRARKVALCHIMLILGAMLLPTRYRRVMGYLAFSGGVGGIGAAWGRWTKDNETQAYGWLDIRSAASKKPSRQVMSCFLEHAPFALAGLYIVARKSF